MHTEPSTWPRVEAVLDQNGTARINIGGAPHTLTADTVDDARPQVVNLIARQAAVLGRPLRALVTDPQGQWPLVIAPDGTVATDEEAEQQTRRGRQSPALAVELPVDGHAPAPSVEWPVEAPAVELPVDATLVDEPLPVSPDTPVSSSPRVTAVDDVWRPASRVAGRPVETTPLPRRQSFLTEEIVEEPATQGWRGFLGRLGIRLSPSARERGERSDIAAVSQHWPGPRTIAIVNSKGGAGKTPTTVCLAAVFARYGGAGVLTWDNNQTRGTLGWRTEQGPHDATLLDLLPQTQRLLGPSSQAADLAHYVHHQTRDRFDVLRSKPTALAHEQRVEPADVDAIHSVAAKYYRLVFIDSGNDESDPMWLRMIDHADQLVVATTTRDDHAEAAALLLEALADRDERSARLGQQSVVVVTQADSRATPADVTRIANGYRREQPNGLPLAREVAEIPFDPAMVDGLLRLGSLRPSTQRAWLAAAAAVARGL